MAWTVASVPHHERVVVLRERTKVLPLDSCVSVTDRHGGGSGGSRIRVSSGEAGEVEGSEEASII